MEVILAQLALAAFNQVQRVVELQLAHSRGETVTMEQVNALDQQVQDNSDKIQQLKSQVTVG